MKVSRFIKRCIPVLNSAIEGKFKISREILLESRDKFKHMSKYVPLAGCVVDGTKIIIPLSKNKDNNKEAYSHKKHQQSVNVLVLVELDGNCIYVSKASPISHDQTQWNNTNLRQIFTDLPVGIIGDKGFVFNSEKELSFGENFIIGYRPISRRKLTEEDRLHNKVIAQLRIVVENFICQMKKFRCIKGVFRHYRSNTEKQKRESLTLISMVVKIIAYLANLASKPRKKNWRTPTRKEGIKKDFIVKPEKYRTLLHKTNQKSTKKK